MSIDKLPPFAALKEAYNKEINTGVRYTPTYYVFKEAKIMLVEYVEEALRDELQILELIKWVEEWEVKIVTGDNINSNSEVWDMYFELLCYVRTLLRSEGVYNTGSEIKVIIANALRRTNLN